MTGQCGSGVGERERPLANPWQGHEAEVLSVAFSPDSQRIVSGSRDQRVRIWDIFSPGGFGAIACNQLRYHSSLNQPTTDVAREAKQACESAMHADK
ncbi:MAG: hypothetical protein HC770_07770 [Pseudanabaena sp. CRU_2_10]|nr:hypothetical protein [Pseudanabaena sp. CRU_2_10]